MASIQEVGKAILTGKPNKFYIFAGEEYGLKVAYIDKLKALYGSYTESESVEVVLKSMGGVHLVPMLPKLYIVRYDMDFLTKVGVDTQERIFKTNIIGTIVCIYQQPKDVAKCMKYLPDYTVRIDHVSANFLLKYLKSDYSSLDDETIKKVIDVTTDYSLAKSICYDLTFLPATSRKSLTPVAIAKAFGHEASSTEEAFKLGVAARNFKYIVQVIESYEGDLNLLLYAILSVMIELEKIHKQQHTTSPYREYSKQWPLLSIYNMFQHTYQMLQLSRKYSISNRDAIVYLAALLGFNPIPSVEDMQYEA